MNYFRKINRGVILTTLIALTVVIYLVALTINHNAEKPKIEELCTKYIQTEISYRMLPKKYRIDNPQIPKDELDKYIADMTNDIKAYYSDNTETSKFLIDTLKTNIENQSKGSKIIYDYKKDNLEFKDFTFKNDSVTIRMSSLSSIDDQNSTSNKISTDDFITLEKIDGEWKVVYSNINFPMNNNQNYGKFPSGIVGY